MGRSLERRKEERQGPPGGQESRNRGEAGKNCDRLVYGDVKQDQKRSYTFELWQAGVVKQRTTLIVVMVTFHMGVSCEV